MKKIKYTLGSGCAVLLLTSTVVFAEPDYPAADFQPKVIFQDDASQSSQPSSATEAKSTSASDASYPAADFQPKILYQDDKTASNNTVTDSTPEKTVEKINASDAAYPAADFQPKVVFNDPNPATSSVSKQAVIAVSSNTKASANNASSVTNPTEETSDFSLFGIVLLAIVAIGFARFKNIMNLRAASTTQQNGNGLTGVARYIATQNKDSLSGVAKYLAKKAEAESKPTGVESYLNNRSK